MAKPISRANSVNNLKVPSIVAYCAKKYINATIITKKKSNTPFIILFSLNFLLNFPNKI